MPSKVVSFTQVPVIQKDLSVIHIERLNPEGTLFNATITYEVWDDQGVLIKIGELTQQGAGVLAAPAIAALLSAINAVEGT